MSWGGTVRGRNCTDGLRRRHHSFEVFLGVFQVHTEVFQYVANTRSAPEAHYNGLGLVGHGNVARDGLGGVELMDGHGIREIAAVLRTFIIGAYFVIGRVVI